MNISLLHEPLCCDCLTTWEVPEYILYLTVFYMSPSACLHANPHSMGHFVWTLTGEYLACGLLLDSER